MKKYVAFATTAAALVLSAPANAALLQFTIFGIDVLSVIVPPPVEMASFRIDSNPVIAAGDSFPGQGFFVRSVAGSYSYGALSTTTPQDISFYTPAVNGGLYIGNGTLAYDGPQLYTGTEAAPVFAPGVFALTDFYTHSPITLTITAVGAVPEPASWALLIGGFGLVGGTLRARRTAVRFANA